MDAGRNNSTAFSSLFILCVLIGAFIFLLNSNYSWLILPFSHRHGGCSEGAAAGSLKTLNGMFHTYKKKGYAGLGRTFPIGNDPTVPNNGKFCGLYYEVNNQCEQVALIGAAEAAADARADGNPDTEEGNGWYIPCTDITTYNLHKPIVFSVAPKQGYWFALMKYIEMSDGSLQPYDKEYSKDHYGLVAWPSEYGVTGESTFIINEEGTVYQLDRGETTGYLEIYPTVTPAIQNWEIAQ